MEKLQIQICQGPINSEIMDLLLLADPNQELIRDYISTADILLARLGQQLVAVAVLVQQPEVELKNIAVDPQFQGRGFAKTLIAEVCAIAKQRGAERLLVATGNSSLQQLGLYQKCGFRIEGVKADFFSDYPEEIIEHGILCQDLVLLRKTL